MGKFVSLRRKQFKQTVVVFLKLVYDKIILVFRFKSYLFYLYFNFILLILNDLLRPENHYICFIKLLTTLYQHLRIVLKNISRKQI